MPVESPLLTTDLIDYLNSLVSTHPAISACWLIGSRANRIHSPISDWDFIVFADPETLRALRHSREFDRPDVDLLVVYDGEHFESPPPHPSDPQEHKKGALKSWQWQADGNCATYRSIKPSGEICRFQAHRVYQRPE